MRRKPSLGKPSRIFTASEVAEFEYCQLAWWFQVFSPLSTSSDGELFATMSELEHEHGQQATLIPEYIAAEQILLRRGAFEQGRAQHLEHAEKVAKIEEERVVHPEMHGTWRLIAIIAAALLVLSFVLIMGGLLIR